MYVTNDTQSSNPLAKSILERVEKALSVLNDDFNKMHLWQQLVKYGAQEDWLNEDNHVVNVTDSMVQQWTAILYARNPTIEVKVRDRIDYTIWDGSWTMLEEAQGVLQQAQQAMMMAAQQGMPPMNPVSPETQSAQAVLDDYAQYQQGKDFKRRVGSTLEFLYDYFTQQQESNFESKAKQSIRRAFTNGIAWAKIGYQREDGYDRDIQQQLNDTRTQLVHLRQLHQSKENPSEQGDIQAQCQELIVTAKGLASQTQIIKDGPAFTWPRSTDMIVDPQATSWMDLSTADWIAERHLFLPDELQEQFPEIDMNKVNSSANSQKAAPVGMDDLARKGRRFGGADQIEVFEVYDRKSGVVYWVSPDYDDYLQEPDVPTVDVSGFYPYAPLVFNDSETDHTVAPQSDVEKMRHDQQDINQKNEWAFQDLKHSLPKYITRAGAMEETVKEALGSPVPGLVIPVKAVGNDDLSKILSPMVQTGYDQSKYVTGPNMENINQTTNVHQAMMGAPQDATATAVSVSQSFFNSSATSKRLSVDTWLRRIARMFSQVCLGNMDEQTVKEIVGYGAQWPQLTRDQIATDVWLDIEAGSTVDQNRSHQIMIMEKVFPLLFQLPGVNQTFLIEQAIKSYDPDIDLSRALAPKSQLSTLAQNAVASRMGGPGGGAGAGATQGLGMGAQADPTLQGILGGMNAPTKGSTETPPAGGTIPSLDQQGEM